MIRAPIVICKQRNPGDQAEVPAAVTTHKKAAAMRKQNTPDPRLGATHTHALTPTERAIVDEAMQELQDLTYIGTGDAADAGLEGIDALDQVDDTRTAVAKATKVVSAFRRRVTRSRS